MSFRYHYLSIPQFDRPYSPKIATMRFYLLPISLLLVLVEGQFIYPFPLENHTLVDYTSGNVQSALNFSAGDDMLGAWSTPVGLASFFLLRCTHTPSSTPIYPSNSTFNSTIGSVSADGTWEQMPFFTNGMFANGFNSGSNIFFSADFFQGNSTTGQMCWFELYPGHDSQNTDSSSGIYGQRTATVNGGGAWYFASEPFVVKPMRPTGQVVTWRDDGTERGKPTTKIGGNSTSNTNGTEAGNTTSTTTKSAGHSLILGESLCGAGLLALVSFLGILGSIVFI